MKIVITGGHFSPAHAVIQKIKSKDEILVVGRRYAFEGEQNETYEYKACVEEGIPFENINAGRLQRKLSRHSAPSLLRFPSGVLEAVKILKKFKPDVVVTFGGYVGLPVAIAATVLKIPVILHEQTLRAGLASRLIAKFATVVLLSFESSKKYFRKSNTVITGLPLRNEIFTKRKVEFRLPTIYITGGSTGSHAVNENVFSILPELLSEFDVIHQTGNSTAFKDYERAVSLKAALPQSLPGKYTAGKFFPTADVSAFLQNVTLVVGRSGINTIAELLAHGTVALLIPLPTGQMGEQKNNAYFYKKIGLGEVIEQKDLTPQVLLTTIRAMIKGLKTYKNSSKDAEKYVHPGAVDAVIEQIYKYGRRSENTRKTTV